MTPDDASPYSVPKSLFHVCKVGKSRHRASSRHQRPQLTIRKLSANRERWTLTTHTGEVLVRLVDDTGDGLHLGVVWLSYHAPEVSRRQLAAAWCRAVEAHV